MRVYIMRVHDKMGNYFYTVSKRNEDGSYTCLGTANRVLDGDAFRKNSESK